MRQGQAIGSCRTLRDVSPQLTVSPPVSVDESTGTGTGQQGPHAWMATNRLRGKENLDTLSGSRCHRLGVYAGGIVVKSRRESSLKRSDGMKRDGSHGTAAGRTGTLSL